MVAKPPIGIWQLAAQHARERTFGGDAGVGIGVVQRCQQGVQLGAVGADLNAQRALAHGRQAFRRRQFLADALAQAQALQAGGGQDDGVELAVVQFAQAGLHIAAQRLDHQMRKAGTQLRFAAQAGRAYHGAVRQLVQAGVAVGNQRVARVFALADGGQGKAFGQVHRHVLDGVHGDIGAAFLQGQFQLFHEQALAADFGQRLVEDLVALGGHAQDFHGQLRVQRLEAGFDVFGLPHGEFAFAAGDDELVHETGPAR